MISSAEAYDRGGFAEAKRLAVAIRVLVHDTDRSKSLLAQLDMKAGQFLDTAPEQPPALLSSYTGLAGIRAQPGPAAYVPNFDAYSARRVPFDEWWTKKTILMDLKRRGANRKRLVLTAANQDGGAHVDSELDDIYADLSRTNSMGTSHQLGEQPARSILGVDHASIRQIAHELLGSLGCRQPVPLRTSVQVTIHNSTVTGHNVAVLAQRLGRNDPCYCGSGRKFKKCHGA